MAAQSPMITAGSGWPEDENGEGVVLDDFVFSPLLPEIRITAEVHPDGLEVRRWDEGG